MSFRLLLVASVLFTTPLLATERLLVKGSLAGVHDVKVVKRTLFGWVVVEAPDGSRERLERAPGVKAVEPVVTLTAQRVPSDPYYRELWGFQAIDVEKAWDLTTGKASQRIGLVDTGIRRNHVDLAAHDAAGWDFVSDPDNAGDGDGRDDDYSDEGGRGEFHGSHVAGTILARGDDHHGVPGVNWKAKLVTARALGVSGGGDLVDIMEGAAWLAGFDVDGVPSVGDDKVSVINMSIGTAAGCSRFERDVTSAILDAGVTLVAAAGNDGGATQAPANCPGVIAVGAVDSDLGLASYSSFDGRTDVVAPGGDMSDAAEGGILSVDGADAFGYKYLEGTSMAAPHVTGVVSLMQAVNPSLSPAELRTLVMDSPYTCDGCDDHAFLDAADAVDKAQPQLDLVDGGVDVDGCDVSRGNWDCPAGSGCVDGACIAGEQGRAKIGEACGADDDCNSGLCDRSLCTKPCDDGCPANTTCDDDVIPGGLCRVDDGAARQKAFSCAAAGCDGAVSVLAVALGLVRSRRRRA